MTQQAKDFDRIKTPAQKQIEVKPLHLVVADVNR